MSVPKKKSKPVTKKPRSLTKKQAEAVENTGYLARDMAADLAELVRALNRASDYLIGSGADRVPVDPTEGAALVEELEAVTCSYDIPLDEIFSALEGKVSRV